MTLAVLFGALLGRSPGAEAQTLIEPGTTVHGKSELGKPDLHAFVGEAGSQASVAVDTPGEALLTLYTPRGEEMLHATGRGKVQLEAVLPLTNGFLVGRHPS